MIAPLDKIQRTVMTASGLDNTATLAPPFCKGGPGGIFGYGIRRSKLGAKFGKSPLTPLCKRGGLIGGRKHIGGLLAEQRRMGKGAPTIVGRSENRSAPCPSWPQQMGTALATRWDFSGSVGAPWPILRSLFRKGERRKSPSPPGERGWGEGEVSENTEWLKSFTYRQVAFTTPSKGGGLVCVRFKQRAPHKSGVLSRHG